MMKDIERVVEAFKRYKQHNPSHATAERYSVFRAGYYSAIEAMQQKQDTNNLLPCPFCGQLPLVCKDTSGEYIVCDNRDCLMYEHDTQIRLKDWNRRPRRKNINQIRKEFEEWSHQQGWPIDGYPDARQRWLVWKSAYDRCTRTKLSEEELAHLESVYH